MQTGKNAMEAAKEKVANVNATALSGMNKAKATAQEKVDKMTKSDPMEKERAEMTKQERIGEAEREKQQAYHDNAVRKDQASHTGVGGHATHGNGLGGVTGGVGHHHPGGAGANPLGHIIGRDHAAGTGAGYDPAGVQTAAGTTLDPNHPTGPGPRFN